MLAQLPSGFDKLDFPQNLDIFAPFSDTPPLIFDDFRQHTILILIFTLCQLPSHLSAQGGSLPALRRGASGGRLSLQNLRGLFKINSTTPKFLQYFLGSFLGTGLVIVA